MFRLLTKSFPVLTLKYLALVFSGSQHFNLFYSVFFIIITNTNKLDLLKIKLQDLI
jgi:hypothetical protein